MTRSRIRTPDTFDPQFRQVFLRGLKESFVIPFANNSQAQRFRAECYAYRMACHHKGDPEADMMFRVELKIKKDSSAITVSLRHSEFADAFKAAGAKPAVLDDDPLAGLLGDIGGKK